MRKKLDTRFPAARIKKIMQADEDVGKIAMAVPVLVSKALELFLQDLCDRTYDITLQRGAKTVNSLHLKHCVQSYNVFDFLREVVSKVPDYGHSDASTDDRTMSKRRKTTGDELNDSDDESKSRMHVISHATSSGRGRGRGRGRVIRVRDRESSQHEVEFDPCTSIQQSSKQNPSPVRLVENDSESMELLEGNSKVSDGVNPAVRSFDLNADLGVNVDRSATVPVTLALSEGPAEVKNEYPGWSLSEVDRMAIDPLHLAHLNSRLDEEEENYDDEE